MTGPRHYTSYYPYYPRPRPHVPSITWQQISEEDRCALFDLSLQDTHASSQALERAAVNLISQASLQVPSADCGAELPSRWTRFHESTWLLPSEPIPSSLSSLSTSAPGSIGASDVPPNPSYSDPPNPHHRYSIDDFDDLADWYEASFGSSTAHHSSDARASTPRAPNARPTTAHPTNAHPTDALATDALAADALATDALAPNALAPNALATDARASNARASNALAPNALATDARASNARASNALAPNALAPNARASNALASNALAWDTRVSTPRASTARASTERTVDTPEVSNFGPYIPPADDPLLTVAMSAPDFITNEPTGASIMIVTPMDPPFTLHNVSRETIEKTCPLLAASFEETRGAWKCILDVKDRLVGVSLLRFLHTGTYLTKDADGIREVVPASLLFHVQMFHLACTFDVTELHSQTKVNITRVTEYACSTPKPAKDLCAAIALVYKSLSSERELKSMVLHLVVSCFDYHKLKDDPDFCALVRDFPDFGTDLCHMNFAHNFRDDGAADIIRLPMPPKLKDFALKQAENDALLNFVYDMWGPEEFASRTGYETGAESDSSTASIRRTFTLVRRPKARGKSAVVDGDESESSMSEAEGFSMVKRPKQFMAASAASADPPTSLPSGDAAPPLEMVTPEDGGAADNEDSDGESVESDFTIVG